MYKKIAKRYLEANVQKYLEKIREISFEETSTDEALRRFNLLFIDSQYDPIVSDYALQNLENTYRLKAQRDFYKTFLFKSLWLEVLQDSKSNWDAQANRLGGKSDRIIMVRSMPGYAMYFSKGALPSRNLGEGDGHRAYGIGDKELSGFKHLAYISKIDLSLSLLGDELLLHLQAEVKLKGYNATNFYVDLNDGIKIKGGTPLLSLKDTLSRVVRIMLSSLKHIETP